jgi:hypothetical protein
LFNRKPNQQLNKSLHLHLKKNNSCLATFRKSVASNNKTSKKLRKNESLNQINFISRHYHLVD